MSENWKTEMGFLQRGVALKGSICDDKYIEHEIENEFCWVTFGKIGECRKI